MRTTYESMCLTGKGEFASLYLFSNKLNKEREEMIHKLLKLKLWFKGLKRLWTITSIEHRFSLYEVRISELEEKLKEQTIYSYEKHPLINIPVKTMVDDNAHKCQLSKSELYDEIRELEKKLTGE